MNCLRARCCLSFKQVIFFSLIIFLVSCKDRAPEDEVVYFVMPDRFENGRERNDTGGIDGDRTVHGFDASDESYYHGGDIRGLHKKLPYLRKLGVTSLWLTPIFKNSPVAIDGNSAAYHGYWIQDYTQVDPHLGTNRELKRFIRSAHRYGINVYFDIVVNHTADIIRYEECHNPDGSFPDSVSACPYRDTSQTPYSPFVPSGLEDIKQPEWLNDFANYHNRGDSSFSGESDELGDFFGLDDINTEDPVVVQGMIDIFKYWIKEFDIDGFRLDTAKHVNIEFWQEWTPAIKHFAAAQGKEDFLIFGEIFDGNPKNVSRYTTEGTLPSALDFGLYFAMRDVFATNAAPTRIADMFAQDDYYIDADSNAYNLLSFVSNHDIGRLGHQIVSANPNESDEQHLARLQQAYALMYFGRGIPVIYYGDEQGFVGGDGDKANREDMMPSLVESQNQNKLMGTDATTADANFDRHHPMYQTLRSYKKVLDLHPTLRRGKQYARFASDAPGILAISRVDPEYPNDYLVVLNTSTQEQSARIPAAADSYMSVHPHRSFDRLEAVGGELELTLPPLSTVVYKSRQLVDGATLANVGFGLAQGSKRKGRFEVPALITLVDEDHPLPLIDVDFEVSVDDSAYTFIGTDYSDDFRVYFDTLDLQDGTALRFRATAKDRHGNAISAESEIVEVGVQPGMNIIFKKPATWSDSINIYYWDAEPAPGVDWPGVSMTDIGNGFFQYQFPDDVGSANIVFNDGANQTSDLYRESDGCYIDSAWQDSCDSSGSAGGFVVYFQQPEDWSESINIYYWQAAPLPDATWPGVPMQVLGDGWFRYAFPESVSSSNVIFNDGSNQTADLSRDRDGCYIDGAWVDVCDAPMLGLLVTFVKPPEWGDAINVYYWNAAGSVADAAWPGFAMEEVANGWYQFRLPPGATSANIIFNDGQGNQTVDLFREGDGCFGVEGQTWSDSCDIPVDVQVSGFGAHWLDSSTIAWQPRASDAASYRLYVSDAAALDVDGNQILGASGDFELSPGASLSQAVAEKFRHLANFPAFSISLSEAELTAALKSQLYVAAFNGNGVLREVTRVQTPGVIDGLYATDVPLGLQLNDGSPRLSLWAPTAQEVLLNLYDANKNLLDTVNPSSIDNGVYNFDGSTSWLDLFYKFEITVYHPETDALESYEVTDPYALSLSTNSEYSQIVDLENDAALKPPGWDALVKSLPEKRNISVYEGHVSDFSDSDELVALEHRGKYKAFTYNGENGRPLSHGMQHLKDLAAAGLTHFHLLPVNDIATVNEDPTRHVRLDEPYTRACELSSDAAVQDGCSEFAGMTIREAFEQLSAADPVNERVQAIANALANVDPVNWGYDPFHFLAIEGSYATNSDGKPRILEFREMVAALDELGLKVVVDVVFNHTNDSGISGRSVLDKVVPGYYHRRNPFSGFVENSTCCENTAAEHVMMERLMIDTVVLWAEQYKIDAFRFDLMGHHPRSTMLNIQAALADLNINDHGVEGEKIYLYGEGWDFGEVSGNQRFDQATQFNMGGTEIGTFNDRLRSAVRGGNFTDTGRSQGFGNGNGTYWNGVANGAGSAQDQADRIRIGLAGNLRDYAFIDNAGNVNSGAGYVGVGYGLSPLDNVVYVDKHDNETLWDNTQAKLPDGLGTAERVRIHVQNQSFVNFAQGIPFHQMGTDILRSKSMDRNSFDSGPWANRVDFSLATSNWASGLPRASENSSRWDTMRQIMSNPNIDPRTPEIALASALFQEQLAVRYSSELFRLGSAEAVKQRVAFWNTGPAQTLGVIAMSISDGSCAGADLDPELNGAMLIFNADDDAHTISIPEFAGVEFALHPVQQASADAIASSSSYAAANASFSVPAHTTAVFVSPQLGAQGDFPCNPHNGTFVEPGFTVYFQKPSDWNELRVYYWNTHPATSDLVWPGLEMQPLGGEWYSFTLPDGVASANLIFNNNNNGQQTADLFREGDGCFDISSGTWSDNCAVPGIALSFEKPAGWGDDMHLYFWNAPVPNPDWPGTPMTDLGNGLFLFQLPDGVRASNVIFNDNAGNQTADLYRDADGCYTLDGGWDSCTQ